MLFRSSQRLSFRDAATPERKTLAAWGLALALFFFILILCQAFPTLILSPTELA